MNIENIVERVQGMARPIESRLKSSQKDGETAD